MTVRRFRAVEDVTAPPAPRRSALENLRAAIELSNTCIALSRRRVPPGVRKFGSIEQASEARRWLEEEGLPRGR